MFSQNAQNFIYGALDPLYRELKNDNIVNGTVEIINASLRFNPAEDMIMDLGTHRKGQHKYAENELKWYLSKDRSIKGHPGIEENKIWSIICSDNGMINSNYGWCVFSPENGDGRHLMFENIKDKSGKSQYDFAIQQLKEKPLGRQSIIFYARPSIQWEWNDGIHAKSDFICTINTQHFIRNNKLDYIVNMRSNDAIMGLHAADLPWHSYVYNKMLDDINNYIVANEAQHFEETGEKINIPLIKPGTMYWNAASLHVYERHFDLLTKIVEEYREWNRKMYGPCRCAKDCIGE